MPVIPLCMRRVFLAALAIALFAAGREAAAQSQVFVFEEGVAGFNGFQDTTIFSESDNSGGGTDGIFSGTIQNLTFGGDKQNRRALIRVDLNTIPSNWVVQDVTLQLTVERSGGNFGDIDYTLHRATRTWGEGAVVGLSTGGYGAPANTNDATWTSNLYNVSAWTAPGGDFDPTPSATAAAGVAGSVATWSSPAMVADVQAWVNHTADNHGWIVVSSIEGVQQRVKKFYSSEAAAFRPVLTVTAAPPAVPNRGFVRIGLIVLLAGAGAAALMRPRRTAF
jgi:hypothetical protein